MERQESMQIVDNFLSTIEKTDEMEKQNSAIPSVAAQYKYKKEELFDNFVLSIIQLLPQKTMDFFGSFKLFFFIIKERQRFSIHQELDLNDFLTHLLKKSDNFYKENEGEEKELNYKSETNTRSFISKFKLLIQIFGTKWDSFYFDEKEPNRGTFVHGYARNTDAHFHFHMHENKEQKNTTSFFEKELEFMKIADIKNIAFKDLF